MKSVRPVQKSPPPKGLLTPKLGYSLSCESHGPCGASLLQLWSHLEWNGFEDYRSAVLSINVSLFVVRLQNGSKDSYLLVFMACGVPSRIVPGVTCATRRILQKWEYVPRGHMVKDVATFASDCLNFLLDCLFRGKTVIALWGHSNSPVEKPTWRSTKRTNQPEKRTFPYL